MMDHEIDKALAALRRYDPAPGFADRVMAQVAIQQPAVPRRRPSLAVAVAVMLAVAGSMIASIVWTWQHQTALVSSGRQAVAQLNIWISEGLQLVTRYPLTQQITAHVPQIAVALILASVLYVGGLFALFRLMAGPASPGATYARQ